MRIDDTSIKRRDIRIDDIMFLIAAPVLCRVLDKKGSGFRVQGSKV
jgi:hypothetical protein